jgi:hypothetical protein
MVTGGDHAGGIIGTLRLMKSNGIAVAVVVALGLSGCGGQRQFAAGTVTHVVICYLKQPGDATARQRLIEASKEFREIPGVLDVRVGKVLPSTRPIVVNDYDVGLVITYKDERAMKEYVTHPIHEKAVREVLGPLTSKVVVYDFVNE